MRRTDAGRHAMGRLSGRLGRPRPAWERRDGAAVMGRLNPRTAVAHAMGRLSGRLGRPRPAWERPKAAVTALSPR